mmetsp:Transcript_40362/g.79306  ORF Transcript_40362/g.79306 Transcript_40362/m.79306 type:complete len:248 (-) Transcript_40362:1264-2007(-)
MIVEGHRSKEARGSRGRHSTANCVGIATPLGRVAGVAGSCAVGRCHGCDAAECGTAAPSVGVPRTNVTVRMVGGEGAVRVRSGGGAGVVRGGVSAGPADGGDRCAVVTSAAIVAIAGMLTAVPVTGTGATVVLAGTVTVLIRKAVTVVPGAILFALLVAAAVTIRLGVARPAAEVARGLAVLVDAPGRPFGFGLCVTGDGLGSGGRGGRRRGGPMQGRVQGHDPPEKVVSGYFGRVAARAEKGPVVF